MQKINCAIYVRKSTEYGLEQEFNSLDNQELACRSYISSQTFQGWEYFKTYSDGGISGGTMARPGLQQMLNDIKAGHVQCVLVYKIDRLSRSIYDFKRMMKKDFEPHDCNLVSITQSFDTSTAMGKLTLNMLLSFAEFEREVSAERVRDKVRATKAKGLWVGGITPMGYDFIDKKLQINAAEAENVKEIFKTYLESSSMSECRLKLIEKGIRGKFWTTNKGVTKGGSIIAVSSLNRILRNQVYIGKITNKKSNDCFDGQHKAILSKELFNAVQDKLSKGNTHKGAIYIRGRAILTNKIISANGEVFKNRTGNKNGTIKYRYYKTKNTTLPAGDIENIVANAIKQFLDSDMKSLSADTKLEFKQVQYSDELIKPMIDKIIYQEKKLSIFINIENLEYLIPFKEQNYINKKSENSDYNTYNNEKHIVIETPFYVLRGTCINHRCGGREISILTKSENAQILTRALSYAWRYKKLYESGVKIEQIMQTEYRAERTIYKYLNLAYLSPRIVSDILDGNVPGNVNLQRLFTIAEKHNDFGKQEGEFYV